MAKSIKLAFMAATVGGKTTRQYRVISLKNSIDYNPGDVLSEIDVANLCNRPTWDVTVVPFQPEGK